VAPFCAFSAAICHRPRVAPQPVLFTQVFEKT
jgi:hypothetical protein